MPTVVPEQKFWPGLVRFAGEIIEVIETLSEPGDEEARRNHARSLIEKWYRASGIRIRYLPGPIERMVVSRLVMGLVEGMSEFLRKLPAGGQS
jgi:hypothetical protein